MSPGYQPALFNVRFTTQAIRISDTEYRVTGIERKPLHDKNHIPT